MNLEKLISFYENKVREMTFKLEVVKSTLDYLKNNTKKEDIEKDSNKWISKDGRTVFDFDKQTIEVKIR